MSDTTRTTKIIHLANAGKAALECHAAPTTKTASDLKSNWTWVPEKVTCKRCLAAYCKRCER